ncbi:flagellar motor protein MotB [Fibrobacter sp. UWB1]|uniref:OmpA family protein n=1 Tax=Fibrobacter sp. UWB1 TaxID=1964355 RepID=UPI000B522F4F|nr:OmpA family protein [Fibrobacter sp. UWB1]OWV26126.1 flagellar motor protein MotB [Fibrobacter sp. UWB1]
MNKVAMGLALALAASAFAGHPQTINKEGFVGVNKTQSAQSLGHSKLVFTLLGDATFGNDMFPNNDNGMGALYEAQLDANGNPVLANAPVADFVGGSANIGFAIGIWHYFDLGVTLPVYYDQFTAEGKYLDGLGGPATIPNTKVGYVGNLKVDLKARFPLPEDQVFDIAVFGGVTAGTANAEKQGLWIREPEYINKTNGAALAFGTKNTTIKGGLAITMDASKLDGGDGFPFLLHLNGGYRYTMNSDYMSLPFMSAAAEVYFMDFMSVFVEYYWDIQLDDFEACTTNPVDGSKVCGKNRDGKLDMNQLTGALVFHLPVGVDLHMGASYYLGGDKFITASTLQSSGREGGVVVERIRVNPEYTVYGGITWSGFLLAQDRDGDGVTDDEDKCPDDVGHRLNQGCPLGNPDADEDGVCDAWVAEKGFESEFAEVCEGVDQCPNEAGEGDDGCPLDNPDADGDGVCDAWVSQKKMLKKFANVCEGIDDCPAQAGSPAFNGCPTKQPDPDGDGLCSPWVTDEGAMNEFADICKGYDMCPGEAGSAANKGCAWDDPDADNDGLCDPWVTEKKMGFYFEKAAEDEAMAKEWFIDKSCKGIDKCPTELGPANNEGCPLGNPDTDKDGLCDPWVTEKNMLEQYDGICSGVDKCPTEAGEAFAQGCPMESPDPDGDSLCSPWVTKQKMLDQFKEMCRGYDRCELEAGPEWNKGCPIEDDPDPDKDGVCSEWVATKKLQKEFESVCTGIDRCPDEPGDDGHGCPKKAVEKLDGVTFKSGKATLESNAKKILQNVAKKLVNEDSYKDLKIVIQGHTDNVGKEKTNQKLSENRAKEVMKVLTKAGVKKDRIKAIGMGSSCPVDDNSTAEGREMNRRIEMHFVTPDNDGTQCESNLVQ